MKPETRDEFRFEGKTVIVTGGNGGIGQGIVKAFAERDANVVVAGRSTPAAHVLERRGKGDIIGIRTDVTKRDMVDAMVQQTLERFGRIDVLVNNSGGGLGWGRIVDITPEQIDWLVQLNIYGTLHCTQAAVRVMVQQHSGSIVNISSGAAMSGIAGRFDPVYAGCKGFMHALSKSLAVDLGKYNIRVNTVAPGWIVPERTEEISEGSFWMRMQDKFGTPDSFNAEYERTGKLHASGPLPLHRLGRPRDMANAVVYFASDAARHATGQLVSVCGGVNMPS